MERRQFLQGIAALGLTYLGSGLGFGDRVVWAAEQYHKTLAKNTQRKLALLIGINQYEAKGDWLPLRGCLTDVEMQRELLIHRFGFLPADILTLTDQQATRAAIAQAFSEHLVSQALADDLVIIHFSGHGSQIGTQKTLLPVNSGLPLADQPVLDFSLETISLWLRAIASRNVTCVVDAGYINPGAAIVGNFRIRSRPSRADLQFCAAELELKQHLTLQLGEKEQSTSVNLKSILQVSDRLCADLVWRDFSSGAFTYALTQQLWQTTEPSSFKLILPPILSTLEQKAFAPIEKSIEKLAAISVDQQLPKTNLSTADGVILGLSEGGKTATIWLGGLPINTLSDLAVGSIFAQNQTRLQVRSLDQLTAQADLLDQVKPAVKGQLLREQIRVLPKDLSLAIALDLGLAKIERVDAMGAISDIPQMTGVKAAEEYADCIFGTESNSYGLFTVGRSPILGSFGAVSESVGAAIRRLRPKLEGLLAAKLIQFTENQYASGLALRVKLVAKRGTESIPIASISQFTRLAEQVPIAMPEFDTNNTLVVGDRLHCYLENLTEDPLYVQIFSFDPRGKMITPSFVIAPYANDGILPPRQSLIIPHPNAPIAWTVSAPRGVVNLQVIASRFPLTRSTNLREQYARQATSPTSMIAVPNPLGVAQALLTDLSQSAKSGDLNNQSNWLLDLSDWATLKLIYHVA